MRKHIHILLSLILLSTIATTQSPNDFFSKSLDFLDKPVQDFDFSPNSKYLAAIFSNNSIVICNTETWTSSKEIKTNSEEILKVKFSPNGEYLACKTKEDVLIWETESWTKIADYDKLKEDSPIEFHPTQSQIIGTTNKKIILYDFLKKSTTKISVAGSKKTEKSISNLKISPDGATIYTVNLGDRSPLKVYDVFSKKLKQAIEFPEGYKNDKTKSYFDLSPDGNLLVFNSKKNPDFLLFETEKYQPVFSLNNNQEFGKAQFASSSQHLVIGNNSKIKLYDLFKNKKLIQVEDKNPLKDGSSLNAKLSSNGKYIAAITEEGKVHIWDLTLSEKTEKTEANLTETKINLLNKFATELQQIKIPNYMLPNEWSKVLNKGNDIGNTTTSIFYQTISPLNKSAKTISANTNPEEEKTDFQNEMETKWNKYVVKDRYKTLFDEMLHSDVPEFKKNAPPHFYFFIVENGNSTIAYTDVFELKADEENKFFATAESMTRQLKLKGYKRVWLQGEYFDDASARAYQSLLDELFIENGIGIDAPIAFVPKGAKKSIEVKQLPSAQVEEKIEPIAKEIIIAKVPVKKVETVSTLTEPKEILMEKGATTQPVEKEEKTMAKTPARQTEQITKSVPKEIPSTTPSVSKEELVTVPTKTKEEKNQKVETPQAQIKEEKIVAQAPSKKSMQTQKTPQKSISKKRTKKKAPTINGYLGSNGYAQFTSETDENIIIKDFKAKNGNSLLLFLLEKEKFGLAKKVIANSTTKEIINDTNEDGQSALHIACQKANPEILDYILYRNPNINVQDMNGWTPMHYAIAAKNTKLVKLLKRYRANLSIKNKDGLSAVKFARKYGTREIVSLLKK